MRLIDADEYAKEMKTRQDAVQASIGHPRAGQYHSDIEHWQGIMLAFVEAKLTMDSMPTIDAVPLDKLCEWLANNALPAPCYYIEGYCPYENFGNCGKDELPSVKDCWKIVISKWMGELDAAESMVQKT